jgi:hypothetical protein
MGRRFWAALIALVVLAGVVVAVLVVERHHSTGTGAGKSSAGGLGAHGARGKTTLKAKPRPVAPPDVSATLLAKRLPVPVARAVVLAGPGPDLVVVGGLTPTGTSGNGAFLLNPGTGAIRLVAGLVTAVHDASGAVLGGHDVIFGGYVAGAGTGGTGTGGTGTGAGSTASSTVQIFKAPSGAVVPASAVPMATATAGLPQPRSGSTTVIIGTTCYVVGGSDGATADREVLATTDGRTFRAVASLPVPVEYPAVAAVDGRIFVFGGTTVGGHASVPVDDIQGVDPATGQASVVGHLPTALEGASAATLDGHIYIAGGYTGLKLVGTVWGFEPSTATVVVSGHVVPVSFSGLAVMGTTAWLVGGQSAGRPVGTVQAFRPVTAQPPGPRTTTGAKLTPVAGGTA